MGVLVGVGVGEEFDCALRDRKPTDCPGRHALVIGLGSSSHAGS